MISPQNGDTHGRSSRGNAIAIFWTNSYPFSSSRFSRFLVVWIFPVICRQFETIPNKDIVEKRLFKHYSNVTRVGVERKSSDQGCRNKNDITLSATLCAVNFVPKYFHNQRGLSIVGIF